MTTKYHAQRVPLDRGGYEKSSGRYWGTGAPLYLVEETVDGRYVRSTHVRAKTASEAKQKAYGHVTKSKSRLRASRAGKSTWDVEHKIAEAQTWRGSVAVDMLPLFDHLLNLARNDAKHGHRQAAGRLIAKARGFVRKHPRVVSGDRSRRRAERPRRARRDPGGPGRFIVKISRSPRYAGEYNGGATLAEAIVEARTFKATVGPHATIRVVTYTFGKNDPEEGRLHTARVVQEGR
jgi:hypothetical protein